MVKIDRRLFLAIVSPGPEHVSKILSAIGTVFNNLCLMLNYVLSN